MSSYGLSGRMIVCGARRMAASHLTQRDGEESAMVQAARVAAPDSGRA